MTFQRLQNSEKHLMRSPDFAAEYNQVIVKYLEKDYVRKVETCMEQHRVNDKWCLPHFAVVKDTQTTSKIHVVFDAAAAKCNGIALNDMIQHPGPKL